MAIEAFAGAGKTTIVATVTWLLYMARELLLKEVETAEEYNELLKMKALFVQ